MATVPASIANPPRGVAATIANFIVQTCNVTESPVAEQIPDQNGAIAWESKYDTKYDLALDVIGAISTAAVTDLPIANNVLNFNSLYWYVDSVNEVATYNTVKKWSIRAHRYENWPTQAQYSTGTTP